MKSCFIITPIGSKRDIEIRSMLEAFRKIMYPILEKCGFGVICDSSQITDSGMISSQIFDHIITDDLVIANLTGLNPNVMYEVAVRHATGKNIIQICEEGTQLPFDIKDYRTIFYSNSFGAEKDFEEIFSKYVECISWESNTVCDNPVTKCRKDIIPLHTENFVNVSKELCQNIEEEGTFFITRDNEKQDINYRQRMVLIAFSGTSYSYQTNNLVDLSRYNHLIVDIDPLTDKIPLFFIHLVAENGERIAFQFCDTTENVYRIDTKHISGKYKVEVGILASKEKTTVAQIRSIYME